MYTWQEIERNWLDGGQLAASQYEITNSFNTVERLFGHDWIEARRVQSSVTFRGVHPTLKIVQSGQMLALITGTANSAGLLKRIERGDRDAYAELAATFLLCSANQDTELEIEPVVTVGSRTRSPDSRVQCANEPWTYVEVTRPHSSDPIPRVSW